MKRSGTVSLVFLAGAGVVAYGLAHLDPSQNEEDVRVYPGPSECIAARLRSAFDCQSEYETARLLYPTAAPRYASIADCAAHHGPGRCVTGESVTEAARGWYLPVMAGYVIGVADDQNLPPQPIYDHAPQDEAHAGVSHGGGGYCTGSGARIWTAAGGRSSFARVSSAALRGSSFGGFGSTGRSFSSSGRSSFGG